MPWKKDLAKLKQELVKEDPAPAKATPPPKVAPKAPVSKCIEEEDAIFLNAMGLRPQAQPRAASAPVAQAAPPPLVRAEAAPPESGLGEFSSAMGDLKGMKALERHPVERQAESPKAAAPQAPAPEPEPEPVEAAIPEPPPAPQPKAEPPALGPVEMHLAAGMAIEVDGALDLRGHARSDGEERLKERILDGYALGWRTLHVTVGKAPELREMVLDLIKTPEARCVARYAQAPVPMGGTQAWILYFRPLPAHGDNT